MKISNYSIVLLSAAALIWGGCANENEDTRHFDNKVFIDTESSLQEVLFKPSDKVVSVKRELTAAMPIPADRDMHGRFVYDPALVERYNALHTAESLPLPAEMVSIPEADVRILKGSTKSSVATVTFTGIEQLDKAKTYVAPVVLTGMDGVDILQSKSVVYYEFKGAALINVVADIAKNKIPIHWTNDMSHVKTITFEVLLRARTFGAAHKGKSFISTIFGREGNFLVRFGDVGMYDNQLQLSCWYGNFPTKNNKLGLQTNEWVHVALIWDATTGDRVLFHDGKEMTRDQGVFDYAYFDLSTDCYVGYSYEDNRWFDGEVCEMRVWNKQRTAKEIADNMYEVDPESEGLIAYWKFDEGEGNFIKDHSGNGNDITAEQDIKWTSVSINK